MKTSRTRHGLLTTLAVVGLACASMVSSPGPACAQTDQQANPAAAEATPRQLQQMLLSAGAQHEIIKGLIEQGRFDRILPEMKKILTLSLPTGDEDKIAQSVAIIADLLASAKQFALAHKILDEGIARMELNIDKASLLYIKAHVYASEGKVDKALETYKQGRAIDKQ